MAAFFILGIEIERQHLSCTSTYFSTNVIMVVVPTCFSLAHIENPMCQQYVDCDFFYYKWRQLLYCGAMIANGWVVETGFALFGWNRDPPWFFSFVQDVSFYFMKLPLPCEQATNNLLIPVYNKTKWCFVCFCSLHLPPSSKKGSSLVAPTWMNMKT